MIDVPSDIWEEDKYGCEATWATRLLVTNFYQVVGKLVTPVVSEVERVLEVGCADGESTRRLAVIFPSEAEFYASDLNSALVALAQTKGLGVEFHSPESVYKLERKDRSFDMVIMLEVLEHLEYPRKALAEVRRVSKKYVVLSVPQEPWWSFLNMLRGRYWRTGGNTPGHLHRWGLSSWYALLEDYFRVVKMSTPLPWMVALCQRFDGGESDAK